ncbi:hypothetical protein BY996DRAFT_6483045 [Phakopsora pachyrhizi]|nr:hypothetical protein BY996DRAFT_6483045 [Phakopsora pachyrhizi]
MPVKLPKAERAGLGRISQGRRRKILQGRRHIAGPTTQGGYHRADDILQNRRRKGTIAGPTKARIRFGGIRIVRRIRKPWEGKRPAGGWKKGHREEEGREKGILKSVNSYTNSYRNIQAGKGREVSVGLVRRRETPHQRRTDIWGISKAVVGRAVGQDCKRARWRHTEVRSSYHFRVRTKCLARRGVIGPSVKGQREGSTASSQARDSGKLYSFKGKLRQDKDWIDPEEVMDRIHKACGGLKVGQGQKQRQQKESNRDTDRYAGDLQGQALAVELNA